MFHLAEGRVREMKRCMTGQILDLPYCPDQRYKERRGHQRPRGPPASPLLPDTGVRVRE